MYFLYCGRIERIEVMQKARKRCIITSNLTYVLYKDFLGEASRDSNPARPVWSLNCQALIL